MEARGQIYIKRCERSNYSLRPLLHSFGTFLSASILLSCPYILGSILALYWDDFLMCFDIISQLAKFVKKRIAPTREPDF